MTKDNETACSSCGLTMNDAKQLADLKAVPSTPSSHWKANGEPDPHGDSYSCERAQLSLGHLTDDELANSLFINYNVRPSMEEMLSGEKLAPIVWVQAAKDRIRSIFARPSSAAMRRRKCWK